MGFIHYNDGFVCEWCGKSNLPAPKTCRNHCAYCLCSKHVDEVFPGDRNSVCGGKLAVVGIEILSDHSFVLVHECVKCKKRIRNKMAEDDDRNLAFDLWKGFEQKRILGR